MAWPAKISVVLFGSMLLFFTAWFVCWFVMIFMTNETDMKVLEERGEYKPLGKDVCWEQSRLLASIDILFLLVWEFGCMALGCAAGILGLLLSPFGRPFAEDWQSAAGGCTVFWMYVLLCGGFAGQGVYGILVLSENCVAGTPGALLYPTVFAMSIFHVGTALCTFGVPLLIVFCLPCGIVPEDWSFDNTDFDLRKNVGEEPTREATVLPSLNPRPNVTEDIVYGSTSVNTTSEELDTLYPVAMGGQNATGGTDSGQDLL